MLNLILKNNCNKIKEVSIIYLKFKKKYKITWGLGIGDWGLGIGDWAQSPIPNPHLSKRI